MFFQKDGYHGALEAASSFCLLLQRIHGWIPPVIRSIAKSRSQSIPRLPPPRVRESSTHAKDFFERGRAHQRDGRLRQARQWYEKALKADPGLVVALNNLGVIHMQDGRYHAAKKHFEKAIRLKPGYVDPYYNLACLGALRNRTAESLRYLQKAVSLNPDVKGWAAQDADFKGLQHLTEFHAIITPKP